MARFSKAELERLKCEVSVERLAEARGVRLERHGADLLGLCPFHDDHEPSLVITPSKNLWHRLGACQADGSVIDWVMKTEGVSFRHAGGRTPVRVRSRARGGFLARLGAGARDPRSWQGRSRPLAPSVGYEAGGAAVPAGSHVAPARQAARRRHFHTVTDSQLRR